MAVKYVEKPTGESHWVILEDSPNAELLRQELDANSPLWNALLGKKVGEEFVLREDPIQNRVGTIENITSKYEYRCFDSYDHWEDRFPEIFFVRKYQLPHTSDGQPDVSLILKSVDQRVEQAEQLHRIYKEHPLSMTSFARFTQVSVVESIAHLASHDDLPIRCCLGNDQELRSIRCLSTPVNFGARPILVRHAVLDRGVSQYPIISNAGYCVARVSG